MQPESQHHRLHHRQAAAASPFVQVCDRCRWKKIKCDGSRPCANCRNASFPCETRARLSKQATPRSYVQYLEARVRQLEGQRENEWTPAASSSRHSPYAEPRFRHLISPKQGSPKHGLPDWEVLRELGSHVIDEDGFSQYMGPSSGVGFSAMVLQEVLADDDQPPDTNFFSLFTLDDFSRSRLLSGADALLWQAVPTNLPDRQETNRILDLFFLFTQRVFPVLHAPTFRAIVDELYASDLTAVDQFESLAQLYFTLSIGYSFDTGRSRDDRIRDQIRALQTACRCHFTTLHTRTDNLTRLQTLALHSYSLILLQQRSEGLRILAAATTKALESGLHVDGKHVNGNPLETEMRRRVFWCVFILHLFNATLQGLPRGLHEADITIAEPTDVDDDHLTATEIRYSVPVRTKIHRFVSLCKLARLLSRILDVLYTHNKRKHASNRIEQMNRLCCEHLLDQLDFSFTEVPDDLPDIDSRDPEHLAILASFANEQLLYYYMRWLIHRPGVTLAMTDPQFASCLQTGTEAAAAMLRTADLYHHVVPYIKANPATHPMVIFVSSLTPLYRTALVQSQPTVVPMTSYAVANDIAACRSGLKVLTNETFDHANHVRRSILHHMMLKVFGDGLAQHGESTVPRQPTSQHSDPSVSSERDFAADAGPAAAVAAGGPHDLRYDAIREEQIEHLRAHEDLRTFVHEAFSPSADHWAAGDNYDAGPYFPEGG